MLGYWQVLARDGFVEPVDDGDIPGELDEHRRLELRAEIDAIVAADVYGIDRDELEFVLSTFPTAARYETKRYGEFRSARLVLDAYDSIVSGRTPSGNRRVMSPLVPRSEGWLRRPAELHRERGRGSAQVDQPVA